MGRPVWLVGLSTIIGTVLLAGGSGVCRAAEAAQGSATLLSVSGTIVWVDPARGRLTLDLNQQEPRPWGAAQQAKAAPQMALIVNDRTVIVKEGVRLTVADVQASGEPVTIRYLSQGNQAIAHTITFEKPEGSSRASGTVEMIDLLKGELVLKPDGLFYGGQLKTFAVSERTVISEEGQRRYLSSLRAGEKVLLDYTMEGGKSVAHAVVVQTPQRHLSSTTSKP